MVTVYKDMNADIKAFNVYKLVGRRLVLAPEIVDIYCYDHYFYQLHHFIKAQQYKSRPEWYFANGIEEKLILLPSNMHEHLESPIYGLSDDEFYRKYRIEKDVLLFNKRKWIAENVKGEQNETDI